MNTLFAADDGLVNGNLDLADLFFLIGVILFCVGGVIALQVKTLYAALVAFGLACTALGLLMW